MKPFGGKQLIVVCEFLSSFDEGRHMFESSLWKKVLSHRYELIITMRQDRSERSFLQCLKEIRLGFCSEVSEEFIKGLSRNLEDNLRREATHIYFHKARVLFFNCNVLRSLPGEFIRLVATDQGNKTGIFEPLSEELEKLIHRKHPTHLMGQIMWC